MRETMTHRMMTDDAKRLENKTKRDEFLKLQLQLKIQKAELEKQKLDGSVTKAAAKKQLAVLDAQKKSMKDAAASVAALDKFRLTCLASFVAKRIKKFWSGKGNVWKELLSVATEFGPDPPENVKNVKKKLAPQFFKVNTSCLRNITHKGWAKKKPPALWCSPKFSLVIFEGSQSEAKIPEPKPHLRKLIAELLPGYFKFLGAGFSVDQLLSNSDNVADSAFLEAVWRYTCCVGIDKFTPGLDTWPPEEEAESEPTTIEEPSGSVSMPGSAACVSAYADPAPFGADVASTACSHNCPGCLKCKKLGKK